MIKRVAKKKLVFCHLVWNYFEYPEESEARRERAGIYMKRRFHRLIR